MAKLVYALYDVQEMNLSQFTADATILVKDAVSAYMVEKVIPGSSFSEENAKDFLTDISKSASVEELMSVLNTYDFKLAFMPIN